MSVYINLTKYLFRISNLVSMPPMLPYPILEVDLVLVEEQEGLHGEDEFSCMVTCPTCGTVNEHGLSYISLG